MPRSDDSLERLRAALDDLAAADAADLLAEARTEARARIRAALTDALADSMLERLHEQLPATQRDEPRPTGRAREKRPVRRRGQAAAPPREEQSPPVPQSSSTPQSPPAPQSSSARQSPPAPPAGRRSRETAWYVYGVVGGDTMLSGSLPGVDPGWNLTILREGALAAVSSQVPLEDFDEARLREHLADMAWVEETARAHEGLLERIREQVTVIPMRMCTVYRTEGGIREMLSREAAALQDALDRLDGKAEWGVKVFTDIARAGGGIHNVDTGAGDAPGTAYMERKRTEQERRQRAIELAEDAAARVHERLSAVASDAQVIPLQRREASGHRGDMILNGVYLLAEADAAAFHDEVRALQDDFGPAGIEIVPTGPWPAYNFVPGTIGAAW
ncbi:MAG: GvpL/GvpF family gas vesicle protein [Solirubrobacterales bacterium]|nr:GvpL/GvpF family gas vesicle protein [Solirubrobacterales bacterium]